MDLHEPQKPVEGSNIEHQVNAEAFEQGRKLEEEVGEIEKGRDDALARVEEQLAQIPANRESTFGNIPTDAPQRQEPKARNFEAVKPIPETRVQKSVLENLINGNKRIDASDATEANAITEQLDELIAAHKFKAKKPEDTELN